MLHSREKSSPQAGRPMVVDKVTLGGNPSPRHKAVDELDQRQMAFVEIGRLRQPVIHLHVDVGVIVRIPGGFNPSAQILEVGGSEPGRDDAIR